MACQTTKNVNKCKPLKTRFFFFFFFVVVVVEAGSPFSFLVCLDAAKFVDLFHILFVISLFFVWFVIKFGFSFSFSCF
jgi:hypothetical protein